MTKKEKSVLIDAEQNARELHRDRGFKINPNIKDELDYALQVELINKLDILNENIKKQNEILRGD